MELYRKIAYNVLISGGARVAGTALALFIIGLTTRYLGKDGFGEYSIALAFLFIFNSLADLGLYNILVREISRPQADERHVVSNIFTLRVFSLFLALSVGVALGWFFPYSPAVKKAFFLVALFYFFLSASQVLMGIFQKYLSTDKAALAETAGRVAQLLLVAGFIYFDLGFFSILWALVISSGVIFLFIIFFSRRYVKFGLEVDFAFWRKVLKEALPLAVSGFFILLYFKLDAVLLSLLKPASDVGLYGAAYKILENLIFFPAMFVGIVMPLLSRAAFAEPEQFKRIFQKTFNVLIISGLPLTIGGMFLSDRIMALIAGREFSEAAGALQFLLVAVFFIFLATLFSNSVIALSKQSALIWIYGAAAVFNVSLNLIFIPRYSYLAAAAITALTELFVSALIFFVMVRYLRWLPSFGIFGKAAVACIVMAGFIYLAPGIHVLALVPVAAFVYGLTLYVIGGISKEDLKLVMGSKIAR